EVVPVGGGADRGVPPGQQHQLAQPVGGQVELGAGPVAVEHPLDAGQRGQPLGGLAGPVRGAVLQVHGGERAEGAVVRGVGVGDGQHHPGGARAVPVVQQALRVDHVGFAVGVGLAVHAVVGGDHQHRAQFVDPPEVAVQHGVEVVGDRGAGGVLVLDVVGQRDVGEVGAVALQDLGAGGHRELAQPGAVHLGQVHADQVQDVLDAVVGEGGGVGLLRGEAHAAAAQAPAEQAAPLVLDVVGQRDVGEVGAVALQDLGAGGHRELAQPGAVHLGQVHADQVQDVLDAVVGEGGGVGLLRGEAHAAAAQAPAEQAAQLV